MDLPKTYNPREVEDEIYEKWEKSGYFNPNKLEEISDRFWKAGPFSVAMPPPNTTAELHAGHAVMLALQDIIVRHARMSGKKTLWLPGTDHAAIATQNVVERQIWETEKKTRHQIGRAELLRRIDEFVSRTRGRIQLQIRKIGSSCDWSREKYTLSPELSGAVRVAFKKMYDAGLIYRGDRIVNWCPRCGTTLADDEVVYKELPGKMYYIRYPLSGDKGSLTIATARPDTLLADTAVAVHPADARYKKFVGQTVMLPILDREIPVIADELVDREFGTGVLKITPGHDAQDFEIRQRHALDVINLYNENGKISAEAASDYGFEDYANLTPDEARVKIAQDLESQGFLEKTEDIMHEVGVCYRCETVVEPIISKQWFININAEFKIENPEYRKKMKLPEKTTLKQIGIAAVKTGAINITPKHFEKVYLDWMENLRDWNISRQIWYGHQIPVYYCENCNETIVDVEKPLNCPSCNSTKLTQDPDTLDTWFSSSLWTFATLGWPEETGDLETYHPTTIMETGYDILLIWVTKMIMMTGFVMQDIPFRQVYLHGIVRDIKGKKMSKSKGNVLNPLEVIEKFGADALRLSLVLGTTPGNDMKISQTKIENGRNFVNKLWNISRFIMTQAPGLKSEISNPKASSLADAWILSELDVVTNEVHKHFTALQFGLAGEALYDFTWNKFADWYIEISKIQNQSQAPGKSNSTEILPYVLKKLLKLWHPFIPFITEHIWTQFSENTLMLEEYPMPSGDPPAKATKEIEQKIAELQELVTSLRNLRAEYRQPPSETFASYMELPAEHEWLREQSAVIEKLARVRINFEKIPANKKMPYFLWNGEKNYLIIPNFDPKKEKSLTEKEIKELDTRIKNLGTQIGSKDFLKKAPPSVVEEMKASLAQTKLRQEKLNEKIRSLK